MRISNFFRAGILLAAGLIISGDSLAAAPASYLDLRSASSERGLRYFWDPLARTAIVEGDDLTLRYHAGSAYALKNGRLTQMSQPSILSEGHLFVPGEEAISLGLTAAPTVTTPAVRPLAVPRTQSKRPAHRMRRVIVDAGHGGKDPGAISRNGTQEKRVTLQVARLVKKGLEARGFEVLMTRQADVFIPLAERSHIANKNAADFFISIHANASTTRSLRGFEIYTLSEATDDAALALERAENAVVRYEPGSGRFDKGVRTILWDLRETENRKESLKAAHAVARQVRSRVTAAAHRMKSANFYVLKWTESPAMLVELGYLSNREDERLLRSSAYQQRMADAIVQGFWDFKEEFEAHEGYTN